MEYCQNCGHECHCGSDCMQNHKDGDGIDVQIKCCENCLHSKDGFDEAEVKYDILDIDSFNGA